MLGVRGGGGQRVVGIRVVGSRGGGQGVVGVPVPPSEGWHPLLGKSWIHHCLCSHIGY